MATGKATNQTTVYYGPSTSTYLSGGSVGPNETVTLLWKEGTYYYIEYNTSTKKKRMYIKTSAISNVSGSVSTYTSTLKTRYVHTASSVYCGPSSSTYESAGSVNLAEEVQFLYNKKENNYALIQYTAGSKKKRAWIKADYLGTSKPTNQIGTRPVGTSFKSNDYPNYPSGKYHGGTDIGASQGAKHKDSVKASFAGKVIQIVDSNAPGTGTSYGNRIVIESTISGTKYRTWYCRLETVAVKENTSVAKGQVIGTFGNTGNCIPADYYHLHLEYRKSPYVYKSDNVDPKTFY